MVGGAAYQWETISLFCSRAMAIHFPPGVPARQMVEAVLPICILAHSHCRDQGLPVNKDWDCHCLRLDAEGLGTGNYATMASLRFFSSLDLSDSTGL